MKGLRNLGIMALASSLIAVTSASAGERARGSSATAAKGASAQAGRAGIARVVFTSKSVKSAQPVVKSTIRARMVAVVKGNPAYNPTTAKRSIRARAIFTPNGKAASTQADLTAREELARKATPVGEQ